MLSVNSDAVHEITKYGLDEAIKSIETLYISSPRIFGQEDIDYYLALVEAYNYFDVPDGEKRRPNPVIKAARDFSRVRKEKRQKKKDVVYPKNRRTTRSAL